MLPKKGVIRVDSAAILFNFPPRKADIGSCSSPKTTYRFLNAWLGAGIGSRSFKNDGLVREPLGEDEGHLVKWYVYSYVFHKPPMESITLSKAMP
jgi:hypothetical protein